ncbi:MAG: hypothetical protein WC657_06140 [Candidatus Paceibacterota bacterium]|jgi:hypothetical protein
MERLTITEVGPLKTFGDNGKEWTYKAGGKGYSTYWPKVSDVIVIGGTYQCDIEVNTKGKYPKSIIKSAVPEPVAGAIPPAPATAAPSTLVAAAQAAGARIIEPTPARDNSTNLSIEWQTCVKAGVELAMCEGCPEWFSDGVYEMLALKLGIEIPEPQVEQVKAFDKINEYLAGCSNEQKIAFEAAVLKSHGVPIRELNAKQAAMVASQLKKGTK